jgi:hypothetical protein
VNIQQLNKRNKTSGKKRQRDPNIDTNPEKTQSHPFVRGNNLSKLTEVTHARVT